MRFPRSSGILLHPTSLPGRFGIGSLGAEAYSFVDLLAECKQQLWQVLPLGPTGYGDSPYASFSAFAGNSLLISLDRLAEDGLLSRSDLKDAPSFPAENVDYGPVIEFKRAVLERSFANFEKRRSGAQQAEFEVFCEEHASWLDSYSLFMALKDAHGGAVWNTWDRDIAQLRPGALRSWSSKLAAPILFHKYLQYQFFRQWSRLRKYSSEKEIKIVGDMPIFVAYDSADVWSHPEVFHIGDDLMPTVVAGVPPDYFSKTGQLWGNPLYRWDVMAERGYGWWIERFRAVLNFVDIVRIDHFRGFEAYWEIPAEEETAVNGRWVKGPGSDFFHTVETDLGQLPLIAEDLGVITPEVEALRDQFGFPGMKVLQFAFGSGADNPYLPHNYLRNCVVYTGTHDNDTAIGWFTGSSTRKERNHFLSYTGTDGSSVNWDLIRMALSSVADVAVIPLQDVLGLGPEARMNTPSLAQGNWKWRYRDGALGKDVMEKLCMMTEIYSRVSEKIEDDKETGSRKLKADHN